MNALSGAERDYFPMRWAGKNERRSMGWVGGGGYFSENRYCQKEEKLRHTLVMNVGTITGDILYKCTYYRNPVSQLRTMETNNAVRKY
jgi:hypothetical protein